MSANLVVISPQTGRLAAAAVLGTSAGTATTLLTLTRSARSLYLPCSLNGDVAITYDGVTLVDIYQGLSDVMEPIQGYFEAGKVIGVYYLDSPLTVGRIGATAL